MSLPNEQSSNSEIDTSTDKVAQDKRQLAKTLQRDFARHRRRDTSHRTFWRWIGVLGMVGWPLAITTVGGAWLGHYLDLKFNTGIRFTLMLLTGGLILGSLVVWNVLKGTES